MNSIPVTRAHHSRLSTIDFKNLGFGNHLSDHMLVADYKNGKWQDPAVVPYGDIPMSPSMLSLHYGQAIFEGMKAFKNKDAELVIFRPQRHHQRLLKSMERMCMPAMSEEYFIKIVSDFNYHGKPIIVAVDKSELDAQEDIQQYLEGYVYA